MLVIFAFSAPYMLDSMFSCHPTSAICVHVGRAKLELVEKLVPQSSVTCAEPTNDHLLLSAELVVSIIFLVSRASFVSLFLNVIFITKFALSYVMLISVVICSIC